MGEIWKDIDGYEGYYQVSNLGNIRSFKNGNNDKSNSPKKIGLCEKSEYNMVTLYNSDGVKTEYVHKIVAEYFLPKIKNKPFVNHIDCNKKNNQVSNLEWCTHTENVRHGIKNNTNTSLMQMKERHVYSDDELMKTTRKGLGLTQTEMANRMGYATQEAISHIETGTRQMSKQVKQHLITIRKHEL